MEVIINTVKMGLKSQEKVYSTIDKALDIFADQLKDPSLSEEARDKLNDRIERMVEKSYQKDSEFKKWAFATVGIIASGAAGVALKNPEIRKRTLELLTKGKSI